MSSTPSHSLWDQVISRDLWKASKYDLYGSNHRGCLEQPSTRKELGWNLFHRKLSIQGIVHCLVVSERNPCPRWMFNLTISIETLIYQRTVDARLFNMCPRIWWRLLDLMGRSPILCLIKSNNSRIHIKYFVHAMAWLKLNAINVGGRRFIF